MTLTIADETGIEQTERSARSQRSFIVEAQLRADIKKVTEAKSRAECKISELETEKARTSKLLGLRADNAPWIRAQFNDALMEIENARALITSFERLISEYQEAIEKLTPSSEQLEVRSKQQQQFAQLALGRVEQDRQADELVKELRDILSKRDGLTAEMKGIAKALDLNVEDGGLDESRFSELLASLPGEQAGASERWCDWFLGIPDGTREYVVIDKELVIQETLTDHGRYSFGGRPQLSEAEARELLREDRAAPTETAAWRCKPPSIVTAETYDAACQAADQAGHSIEVELFYAYMEREKQRTPEPPRGGTDEPDLPENWPGRRF